MEFVPIVALAALVGKIVDFLKYAAARDRNGVVTQLTAWAAGVGGVFLFSASDFGTGIDIGGKLLSDMNGFSKAIVGLMATSLFSTFHDVKKAIDNTDSAVTPTLVPDPIDTEAQVYPTTFNYYVNSDNAYAPYVEGALRLITDPGAEPSPPEADKPAEEAPPTPQ